MRLRALVIGGLIVVVAVALVHPHHARNLGGYGLAAVLLLTVWALLRTIFHRGEPGLSRLAGVFGVLAVGSLLVAALFVAVDVNDHHNAMCSGRGDECSDSVAVVLTIGFVAVAAALGLVFALVGGVSQLRARRAADAT